MTSIIDLRGKPDANRFRCGSSAHVKKGGLLMWVNVVRLSDSDTGESHDIMVFGSYELFPDARSAQPAIKKWARSKGYNPDFPHLEAQISICELIADPSRMS